MPGPQVFDTFVVGGKCCAISRAPGGSGYLPLQIDDDVEVLYVGAEATHDDDWLYGRNSSDQGWLHKAHVRVAPIEPEREPVDPPESSGLMRDAEQLDEPPMPAGFREPRDFPSVSAFLANVLRSPPMADEHGIYLSRDGGWAPLVQVEQIIRHVDVLHTVLRTSCHRDGRKRFEQKEDGSGVLWVRSARHRSCAHDIPRQSRQRRLGIASRAYGQFPVTATCSNSADDVWSRSDWDIAWDSIVDHTRDARELERLGTACRQMHFRVLPALACFCGSGRRSKQLRCGHKLCDQCFSIARVCPECDTMHGPESYNSLFGDTDPRTSEPDLRSLDLSGFGSVHGSGACRIGTCSADSIPFGGTATEYRPDQFGIVRWLERRSFNPTADMPFNNAGLREQEQKFMAEAPRILGFEFFCCLWRLRRQHAGSNENCFQASVWLIPGQATSVHPLDRHEAYLDRLSQCTLHSGGLSEVEAVRSVLFQGFATLSAPRP